MPIESKMKKEKKIKRKEKTYKQKRMRNKDLPHFFDAIKRVIS